MPRMKVKIEGILPLLLHNIEMADPLDGRDGVEEFKSLQKKRAKTKTDHEEIARLEWLLSLYIDKEGKVCIPSDNIEACIREGGKKSKRGKDVQSGIQVVGYTVPLQHDGPESPQDLWEQKRYRFRKACRVGTSRVIRTRPRFDRWSLEFEIEYDESVWSDHRDVIQVLRDAGRCGLGDWRPKFGRFEVV